MVRGGCEEAENSNRDRGQRERYASDRLDNWDHEGKKKNRVTGGRVRRGHALYRNRPTRRRRVAGKSGQGEEAGCCF